MIFLQSSGYLVVLLVTVFRETTIHSSMTVPVNLFHSSFHGGLPGTDGQFGLAAHVLFGAAGIKNFSSRSYSGVYVEK